jgi:hypothetical protein
MICCLLAALVLGPLGLWTMPRARQDGVPDCCVKSRRWMWLAAICALGTALLCFVAWILSRGDPATFHHICRFLPAP